MDMQILDGDALSELKGVVAVIVRNGVMSLSVAEDLGIFRCAAIQDIVVYTAKQ